VIERGALPSTSRERVSAAAAADVASGQHSRRRWVTEGETGATLATAASKQAIERAGIQARRLDAFLHASA